MAWTSVHGHFEVASHWKTRDIDSGPLVGFRSVVDKDVLVRRGVPDSTAEVIVILERCAPDVCQSRVGENLEFVSIRRIRLDANVALEAKGIGPKVLLIHCGRSQDLWEGASRKWTAVLVFSDFAGDSVNLGNELAKEIGKP